MTYILPLTEFKIDEALLLDLLVLCSFMTCVGDEAKLCALKLLIRAVQRRTLFV